MAHYEIKISDDSSYRLLITGLKDDTFYNITKSSNGISRSLSGLDQLEFDVNESETGVYLGPTIELRIGYTQGTRSKISVEGSLEGKALDRPTRPKSKPIVLDGQEDTGGGATPETLSF